jgi:hypothetical protein
MRQKRFSDFVPEIPLGTPVEFWLASHAKLITE